MISYCLGTRQCRSVTVHQLTIEPHTLLVRLVRLAASRVSPRLLGELSFLLVLLAGVAAVEGLTVALDQLLVGQSLQRVLVMSSRLGLGDEPVAVE